jgi:hypothetical protein
MAQFLCAACVFAQGSYKVEPIGAAPSDLPQALRDALQPAGARHDNGQGAAVAEVWLNKSVAVQPSGAKSADIIYPTLGIGTLVGVLRFPNGGSDFRGQPIKAGLYTLRYAQIPQNGNHMGVSTYRDFLLLSLVSADTAIDKPLSFDALVQLSRQASGTGHPAVLSLAPATETKAAPAAFQDDQGHWVLQVQVAGKSPAGEQNFSLGIILVGKTEAG